MAAFRLQAQKPPNIAAFSVHRQRAEEPHHQKRTYPPHLLFRRQLPLRAQCIAEVKLAATEYCIRAGVANIFGGR